MSLGHNAFFVDWIDLGMAMPATKAQDSKSGQKLTHLRGATAMLSCHSCADSEVSESSSSETEAIWLKIELHSYELPLHQWTNLERP